MEITAAGTVPDSHRIPLHQAASATGLPYFGCKITKNIRKPKRKRKLFLFLFVFSSESTFDSQVKGTIFFLYNAYFKDFFLTLQQNYPINGT